MLCVPENIFSSEISHVDQSPRKDFTKMLESVTPKNQPKIKGRLEMRDGIYTGELFENQRHGNGRMVGNFCK